MSRSCAARPPAAATWVRIAPKPSAWISKARTTLTSASPCRPASRSIGIPSRRQDRRPRARTPRRRRPPRCAAPGVPSRPPHSRSRWSPRPGPTARAPTCSRDQLFGHRPLPRPDVVQLRLGFLYDHRDPLAQHVRQIIACPRPRGVHQARHKLQLFDRVVVAQRARILCRGLRGEVSDLGLGHPSTHCRSRRARRFPSGTGNGP